MAARGPARSGRRNVALLEPAAPAEPEVAEEVLYVCGARPLPFGEFMLTEGVEVPGAADWPRLDAWVNARRVRKVSANDPYTLFADHVGMSYEDYLASLEVAALEAELAAQAATEEAAPAAEETETTEE